MKRARAFVSQTIRAMKLLARDSRIPKPLRWIAGLALLPIPGPIDEVILILVAPILFTFFREPMHEAWKRAGDRARAAGLLALSEGSPAESRLPNPVRV